MELRKGYKHTEVGVIPKEWDVKPIGDVLRIRHGKDQKLVQSDQGIYPILGTGGLMGFAIKPLYEKESVLIGRKGTIDKPKYINTPFWTVDTLFYSELKDSIVGKYIYYKFLQIDWYSHNEASGVPSLNARTIENINLAIPPTKAEQTAIATALSDMDDLIKSLSTLIEKKKAIKQGVMQELLKPKEGWVVKKLGEFLDYEQPTNYLVSDTEYDNFYQTPVLTAGKTFVLGYTNEEHGIFNKLPVIIFDDFTTAIKYVDFPFKAKSSAMKMLLPKNDKVNLRFIYEIMQQIKFPLGDHKRHWIAEYSQLDIEVPISLDEQNYFATVLSEMDAEIRALETKLEKFGQVKVGMMQNLLTGKIRLI